MKAICASGCGLPISKSRADNTMFVICYYYEQLYIYFLGYSREYVLKFTINM